MNTSAAEYLDKIAPQAPKRRPFQWNMRNIIFLAVGAVVLVIIIATISSSLSSQKTAPWFTLANRLANTETIVKNSSKVIKNSQLRSLNSDLGIYITNTQRDLAEPFAKLKVTTKGSPASVARSEGSRNTKMTEQLEIGRLNAKYDSTYAREMSYQLSGILAIYQELYSQSGPVTKKILEDAYNNLEPTQKAMSEFSTATE